MMLASKQVLDEAMAAEVTQLSDFPAGRLRIATTRLARRLKPTAAAGTMTTTEVDVLAAAERSGPIRLSDLAAFVGLNPTMLSRLVPRLESGGLIRRLPDESDKRVCRVEATPQGRRLIERIRSERDDALSRRLAELEPAKRHALEAALPVLEEVAALLVTPEAAAKVRSAG